MASIDGTCSRCGRRATLTTSRFERSTGVGLSTRHADIRRLACEPCQIRAGAGALVWTLVLGWWAVPSGPIETVRVARRDVAELRRFGPRGRVVAALVPATGLLFLLIAAGVITAAVLRAIAPGAGLEDRPFVADVQRGAALRALLRTVPVGLADGSEPPAREAAQTIARDLATMLGHPVGVRVDTARLDPRRGETAGELVHAEVRVRVDAPEVTAESRRDAAETAIRVVRARLGDVEVRVFVFGSDARGPRMRWAAGASEPEALPDGPVPPLPDAGPR